MTGSEAISRSCGRWAVSSTARNMMPAPSWRRAVSSRESMVECANRYCTLDFSHWSEPNYKSKIQQTR